MLAALGSCTSTRTTFDWDLNYDFSRLSTWAPHTGEPGGAPSGLTRQRVDEAIAATLTANGFRQVDDSPDFLVAWSVSNRDRIRASGWSGYRGPPRGSWTGSTRHQNIEVEQYEEGSLVIDVVDAALDRLVWRGVATRTLDRSYKPAEAEAIIREAVAKLFAGFPPAP
jgi:hypothetical protein